MDMLEVAFLFICGDSSRDAPMATAPAGTGVAVLAAREKACSGGGAAGDGGCCDDDDEAAAAAAVPPSRPRLSFGLGIPLRAALAAPLPADVSGDVALAAPKTTAELGVMSESNRELIELPLALPGTPPVVVVVRGVPQVSDESDGDCERFGSGAGALAAVLVVIHLLCFDDDAAPVLLLPFVLIVTVVDFLSCAGY
jgi:hypothetical protein